MTLIIQDDLGEVADANSYISVQEFLDYWTARGVDYTSLSTAEVEALLIPALSYMDDLNDYRGYKLNGRDQTTEFPRDELYDCSGSSPVLVEGVPREIKQAQCEYAKIQSDNGTLQPNENVNGAVKRTKEKVDVLEEEIEYVGGGQNGGVISYPQADNKIPKSFICDSGSSHELLDY